MPRGVYPHKPLSEETKQKIKSSFRYGDSRDIPEWRATIIEACERLIQQYV